MSHHKLTKSGVVNGRLNGRIDFIFVPNSYIMSRVFKMYIMECESLMPLIKSNATLNTTQRARANACFTKITWLGRLSVNRLSVRTLLVGLVAFPVAGSASPWLETSDPFLRSSLVLLSDSGQLSSPVNHYPLRWSLFADDLAFLGHSNDSRAIANQELSHSLNNAKLNRGNRRLALLGGSNAATPHGYGQFNKDKKGLYTRYEKLNHDFSYRISALYREYQGETDINWEGSYLAYNAGPWLWSIGDLDRWWGPSWQHNLTLGSYAKAAPDISVSYLAQNPTMGVWSVESIIASPSNSQVDYHSATRFVAKPYSHFEYGVTYQLWFAEQNNRSNSASSDDQITLDAKLTLPAMDDFYHSVYVEAASTAKNTELGAWVLGWTGAFPVGDSNLRLVLETQQTTSAHTNTAWSLGSYPSLTDGVANTSYLLEDSASIAVYWQRSNDHKLGASHQTSTRNNTDRDLTQLNYRLPALAGMVHLGVSYEQTQNVTKNHQTAIWSGYEFRF